MIALQERRSRHKALLILSIALLLFAAPALAQGFGQPTDFGSTESAREFETTTQDSRAGSDYFAHDQILKISIVGGLSLLAMLLVLLRGFRYRRWFLLLPIGLIGVYLGGALCPLSSVQNVFLKWDTAYLLLFLIPVLLALVAGRVFCGYVCPFGAAQELLHVGKWRRRLPPAAHRVLRWLPYGILLFLVVRVVVTSTPILQGLTPFKVLFSWGGSWLAIGLTALFALLSIVLWRPFCEGFCPLGAFLSLISRVSLFRLTAEPNCVTCGRCTASCSSASCDDGNIASGDCLMCGACVEACPVDCLKLTPRWKR